MIERLTPEQLDEYRANQWSTDSIHHDKVLAFVRSYVGKHGYAPSTADIQVGCGISSTSVVRYVLQALEREGHLTIAPGVARGIVVVDD